MSSLNSKIANFLWEKGEDMKGLHLVGWKGISYTKEERGLGIRGASKMNKAFS